MPEQPPYLMPVENEKEKHLLDYLHVVQRRWKIVLVVLILVFSASAVKTYLTVPVYQASAVVRISLKPDTSQEVLEKRQDRYISLDSEIYVLQSNVIAERAAKILQLEWQVAGTNDTPPLTIHRLTVPDDIVSLSLRVVDGNVFSLLSSSGDGLASGQSGIPFEKDEISGLIDLQNVSSGDLVNLQRLTLDEATAMVSQGVSAAPTGDEISMIRVAVQRIDPGQARDVANAIARAYQEQALESKLGEADTILTLIDQQLTSLGRQMNASEQNLQEFKIRTGLQRLSPEGASMVDVAVALEKQRADILLKKQRIESFLNNPGFSTYESSVINELPGINDLLSRLLELRTLRNELLREFTPSHPDVQNVDDKIRLLRREIVESAKLAMGNLDLEIAAIDSELTASAKRLEQVPEEELELARLSRSSQVNAELYSYLLQRQQEARITKASITSNVEIVNFAQLPLAPIKPNKKKDLGFSLVLGLVLGVGLTFLIEYFDQTIKDEEEVQEKFDLKILGSIPRIPEAIESNKRQLITHLEPHSIPSEAFLALRTNVHFVLKNQHHKTVMLSSCLPDEGKSTIAVNLAATMAQTGMKTLLVGCDLRRPSLFAALDQEESPGLSDLLIDGNKKALRRLGSLGFDFIPSGTEPPNPTQLLSSEPMRNFLESAKQKYDLVILDVPPLIPVADALILSSWVDVCLLVLEPCRIPEKLLKRALQLLNNHKANLAGVVINDKNGKGARYYGGYNYYNSKYYEGYYRRSTDGPRPPLFNRIIARIWQIING